MTIRSVLYVAAALLIVPFALADTVKLKDGRTMEGTVLGADGTTVTMDVGGIKMQIPKSSVAGISMGAAATAPPAPAAAPTPQAAAPAAPAPIQVPAGTPIKFRLGQALSSKGYAGQQFTGTLEVAITASGKVAAPAGAKVIGRLTDTERSGALVGKAGVKIELTQLVINGVGHPIVTETVSFKGESQAGKTAKRTIGASLLGGLIDGSDGAKTGAKVGLGMSLVGGAMSRDIKIPSGTILDFRLYQPLTLQL